LNQSWILVVILVTSWKSICVPIRATRRCFAHIRSTFSESGISALLRMEVPLGEVVRLEFTIPTGEVQIHALVRQRNAFRYGFQFLEAISQLEIIQRACRQLAVEQATAGNLET
jgi:hypothetical protein